MEGKALFLFVLVTLRGLSWHIDYVKFWNKKLILIQNASSFTHPFNFKIIQEN
jgi:hypothetical protein